MDNRASQLGASVESCAKVLGDFLWDSGPMNATISGQKLILLLEFAWNTYRESKKLVA